MIIVLKSDESPHLTVDSHFLNDANKKDTHYTQWQFHIVNTILKNTLKLKLDAWNGYYNILLADSARDTTTFITERGRYRYLRVQRDFLIRTTSTKRFDDITVGYPRVKIILTADDSIHWCSNMVHYLKFCVSGVFITLPNSNTPWKY